MIDEETLKKVSKIARIELSEGELKLLGKDLDEIMATSDRIGVMYGGELVGIMPASEADFETLGAMMAGVKRMPGG